MIWIIAMIIKTIDTFIHTKHTYGMGHMCLWRTFQYQKKMHGTSHYTKYGQGGFLLMGSLYPFVGQFFYIFHSIRVSTSLHLPSKNSHTCACAMYTILIDTLFVPPCITLGLHTKSTFEKKDFIGLWTWIDCDLGIRCMFINL